MVVIDTDDPRLHPEHINVDTTEATAALRQAVIDNLYRVDRVFLVMDEESAEDMVALNEFMDSLGEAPVSFQHPPDDYKPPGHD
jgi:hypothetical protein